MRSERRIAFTSGNSTAVNAHALHLAAARVFRRLRQTRDQLLCKLRHTFTFLPRSA
jgi:hypothetical protein